jgi:hypothetical protein
LRVKVLKARGMKALKCLACRLESRRHGKVKPGATILRPYSTSLCWRA